MVTASNEIGIFTGNGVMPWGALGTQVLNNVIWGSTETATGIGLDGCLEFPPSNPPNCQDKADGIDWIDGNFISSAVYGIRTYLRNEGAAGTSVFNNNNIANVGAVGIDLDSTTKTIAKWNQIYCSGQYGIWLHDNLSTGPADNMRYEGNIANGSVAAYRNDDTSHNIDDGGNTTSTCP